MSEVSGLVTRACESELGKSPDVFHGFQTLPVLDAASPLVMSLCLCVSARFVPSVTVPLHTVAAEQQEQEALINSQLTAEPGSLGFSAFFFLIFIFLNEAGNQKL